jgi:fructosamine-3-kinase
MEPDSLWQAIAHCVQKQTGVSAEARPLDRVFGGDINQSFRVKHGSATLFVKTNKAPRLRMFQAEAAGLQELGRCGGLRTPTAIGSGSWRDTAFLVLEHFDLVGQGDAAALGHGLARTHSCTAKEHGWVRDNTLGSSPQPNLWTADWVQFWRDQRLGFQLRFAGANGYGGRLQRSGERLLDGIGGFFEGYTPQASLLHGDLWGGNYGYLADGQPVVFDPAVYYGDRETDLAMTELFGGFSGEFYAAYRTAWPLDDGYRVRRSLYQLYHILNHLNLFGRAYLSRAQALIDELLGNLGAGA